jgi:hypothetical protein
MVGGGEIVEAGEAGGRDDEERVADGMWARWLKGCENIAWALCSGLEGSGRGEQHASCESCCYCMVRVRCTIRFRCFLRVHSQEQLKYQVRLAFFSLFVELWVPLFPLNAGSVGHGDGNSEDRRSAFFHELVFRLAVRAAVECMPMRCRRAPAWVAANQLRSDF